MIADGMMDNENDRYMKPVSEMSDLSEPRKRRGIARGSERKGHDPLYGAKRQNPPNRHAFGVGLAHSLAGERFGGQPPKATLRPEISAQT